MQDQMDKVNRSVLKVEIQADLYGVVVFLQK